MGKLVILDIDGNLQQGAAITLEIRDEELSNLPNSQSRVKGRLPPAPLLLEQYRHWQSFYCRLSFLCRLEDRSRQLTNGSRAEAIANIRQSAIHLTQSLNNWLSADTFRAIREKLLEKLLPADTVRIIIQVDEIQLRRLPWHSWDFFDRYPKAEVALSPRAYESVETSASARETIRILAVLGNPSGIDIEADRQLLENLPDGAETVFLVEPTRRQLYQQLWDAKGWDILFFAGHSSSQGDGETGEIEINKSDRLSLDELTYALKKAIANGLQLAIFNSCDGLGLARSLESLHIPQIIVMRELVPDLVAQEFLKHFLTAFSSGQSFYTAVREAREQLQALEDECPSASWLPIICQNPTAKPLGWCDLVRREAGGVGEARGAGETGGDKGVLENAPCPYRGLSAFREEDAKFFFGREAFTEKLVKAVQEKSLVAVIGSSGSGKSSVVCAGLIPKLRYLEKWLIVYFRPGNNPFVKLAEPLIPLLELQLSETQRLIEINKLAAALRKRDISLSDVTERILQKHPEASRLLLVADQFEELYALCRDVNEQQFLLDSLLGAVKGAPEFTLVLTLRADFFDHALGYRPFAEALAQFTPEFLGPMNRQELQAAVEMPAIKQGVTIEEGLSVRILDAVSAEPGNLPLLEFALTLLWERQTNGKLSHAAYDAIGGVEQALATHAEKVYGELNETEQKRIQQIFFQLVRPGEGTADTRRVALRSEVGENNWDLVRRLADARLVVSQRNEVTGEETVEIGHEALIRVWQRLRQWIEDDRTFCAWQERLRTAMRQWEICDRDEGALLRGVPLLEAQRWLQERQANLSQGAQAFIQASLALQAREQAERDRLRRYITLGLSTSLTVAFLLAGGADWQRRRAEVGETNAQLNALSTASEEFLASHKELEALIESLRAGRQLKRSVKAKTDTQIRVAVALHEAVYRVSESNRLEGHDKSVISVSFSPDGQILASASDDYTIKLWKRDGTLLKTLKGHSDRVISVSFSPDGQTLASASDDQTIKLWRKDSRGEFQTSPYNTFQGHQGVVTSVSFSPDGQTLASTSADRTIKLWRKDGTELQTLNGHRSWVNSVSFSPDGQTLASVSSDKTIMLWRKNSTGRFETHPYKILRGHDASIYRVSFSPDGQTLASASADKTIKLWRLDGTQVQTLHGHSGRVWSVSFSPNGQTLASSSSDDTIKFWRKDSIGGFENRPYKILRGHNASVFSVSFSPDGQMLASASADTTIKLWHGNSETLTTLTGRSSWTGDASFSPDSQTLALGSTDGTVQLWHKSGTLLNIFKGHNSPISSVSFSPDGQTIASASANGVVKLWHKNGNLLNTFKGHRGEVRSVTFSPDGHTLASAGNDNTVKLWRRDSTGGFETDPYNTLKGHSNPVSSVSFSPDGKTIVSVSADETVRLWGRDGTLSIAFKGHNSPISSVSFSPDGHTFASTSIDGMVKVWKRDGTLLHTFKGHSSSVTGVSFSPDSQTLASASADNSVKLWHRDGTLLKTLNGHRRDVVGVSFSPDGETLVSVSADKTAILWNLNLDSLTLRACNWIQDYLKTSPNISESDRHLCDGISSSTKISSQG